MLFSNFSYIETRGTKFEPQKPTMIKKFLSMFASEKDVAIDGFTCKAYRASNFEIVRHMLFNLIAYLAFSRYQRSVKFIWTTMIVVNLLPNW